MKNRAWRRLAASFMAVVLGISMTASTVFAAELPAEKEETVYVNANADGSVDKITVSEWLKNTGKGAAIPDQTSLTNIENVKGDETFEAGANGALTWQAGGNDIYYQGETNASLPVSMKFTYTLDGREIPPEELAGKSGKVKIRIDYTNHTEQTVVVDGKAHTVCTPFCMITGMILSTDNFTNVEVENGKLISDGKNNIVVGVAFPGLSESLELSKVEALSDVEIPDHVEITADAEDFSLALTATVATTGTLSELGIDENEDFDSLKEDLDQLKDASAELVDGSGELSEGAKDLLDAFGTFTDGLDSASEGAEDLKDGIDLMNDKKSDLIEGMEKLAGGLRDLNTGAAKLKAGTDTYTGGVDQVAAGAKQVDEGVGKLKQNLQAMASSDGDLMKGLGALVQGSSDLKDGLTSYTSNAKKLSDGLDQLNGSAGSLVGALAGVPAGAVTIADNADRVADGLDQVLQTMNGAVTQIKTQLGDAAADIQSAYGTLSSTVQSTAESSVRGALQALVEDGTLTQEQADAAASKVSGDVGTVMAAGGQEISQKLGNISIPELGSDTFTQNVADLKSAAQGLKDGVAQITKDPQAFQTTLKTAASSIQALADGAAELVGYNDGLSQGAASLASGSASLAQSLKDALPQLISGVEGLKAGTEAVNSGTTELAGKSRELRSGAAQVLSGSEELLSGSEELLGGGETLSGGIGQLADGAASLVRGMAQLVSGGSQISNGISTLTEGAQKLSDGVKEFDEQGIHKLTDTFDTDFQETIDRVKAVVDADQNYQSFGGLADGMQGSVKFIIETAGIEKE